MQTHAWVCTVACHIKVERVCMHRRQEGAIASQILRLSIGIQFFKSKNLEFFQMPPPTFSSFLCQCVHVQDI